MKKEINIRKYWVPIVAFLVSFVPRMILNLYATPFRTVSDEFNTLSVMALINGKNWSEVVCNGGYYGFGYTALYSPLFFLIKDPIALYRTILVIQSFLQASVAVLAYHLLKKYFHVTKDGLLFVSSVACSYMVVTRTMLVFNEHGLIFCSWLIAWLLLRLVNENTKTRDTILLMLLMSYTLTMHTRSWIFWIGFACTFVFYAITRRKVLVSPVPAAIAGGVGVVACRFLVKYVQGILWYMESGETIRNSALKINKFDLFLDVNSWQAWLNTIMGLFNSFALISGGLLLMAFAMLVYYVYVLGKKVVVKDAAENVDDNSMILIVYFGLMIVGTIFAISIRWLPQTMEAMMEGVGSTKYGLKAVTYARYAAPFCGPVLLAVIAFMDRRLSEFKKLYNYVVFAAFALQVYWTCCVIPYMFLNNQAIEIYLPFSFQKRNGITMGRMVFLPGGVLLCALVVLFWILLYTRKRNLIITVLMALLMYQYVYNCVAYDIDTQKENIVKVDASYHAMDKLLDSGVLDAKEIYVQDLIAKGNHQVFYLYQFYFRDLKVHVGYPSEDATEAVIFTNDLIPAEKFDTSGYQYIQLDDNEYYWVKGERLCKLLQDSGFELHIQYLQDSGFDLHIQ